MIHKICRI